MGIRRFAGVWWMLGAGAVVTVLVLSPLIVQLAVIGLAVLTLLTIVLPFKVVVVLWGALLPVWSVGSLDPMIFDGARVALALMILVKSGRVHGPTLFTRRVIRYTVPLSVVAIVLVILGMARPDAQSLTSGATMLLGLAVASVVICRLTDPWPLLNGYLLGITASAAVIFASAAGFTALAPQTATGFFRLTGLSPSATLVTYQLAVGVAIGWGAFSRRVHRGWYVLAMLACLAALALSGGRGGVLALGLAVVIAVRWGWFRLMPVLILAVVGWIGLTIAENMHLTVNTLQRLVDSAQTGESDGRLTLIIAGIQDVVRDPIAGPGLDAYRAQTGLVPHLAILTFFVAGGILCGAIILYITLALIWRVLFSSPKPYGPAGKVAYLILVVVIVMSFLEPAGPFVGTEFLTLLLACVGITSRVAADGLSEPEQAIQRRERSRPLVGVQRR